MIFSSLNFLIFVDPFVLEMKIKQMFFLYPSNNDHHPFHFNDDDHHMVIYGWMREMKEGRKERSHHTVFFSFIDSIWIIIIIIEGKMK